MKKVELTNEEIQLIARLLSETQYGGDLATIVSVSKIAQGILDKLLTLDEPSSA